MYSLCCIAESLKPDYQFQTMTWKRFGQLGGGQDAFRELSSRWLNNIKVTQKTIGYCAENGWNYRVSSSLFPLLNHPDFPYSIEDAPDFVEIMGVFNDIADSNRSVRLSMHPDQFVVLASDNEKTYRNAVKDLEHHGWIMDMLGCERSYQNPINVHINTSKGELGDIARRFTERLGELSDSVQSRLVVENDDKGPWTVRNLLDHFDIPVTFDTLHHQCSWSDGSPEECIDTWGEYKPLFHYSESHPDKPNPRCHADMPTECPPNLPVDWDLELKAKCLAIRRLEEISRLLKD